MKKKNILAILATLSVVLVAFTACSDKKKDKDEDEKEKESSSAVAEETTEKEAIEYETVVVTEPSGEIATDANGETKVTVVEKPSKPVPTKPSTGNNATTAPGGNSSTPDTPVNSSDLKLQKLVNEIASKKTVAFESAVPIEGQEYDINMYVKGDKIAMEMDISIMSVRMIYEKDTVTMIIPSFKAYMSVPADQIGGMDIDEMTAGLNEIINTENLDYVSTTTEKVGGKNYVCETYKDGVNTNKYYFDSSDNLKRIEIIDADGNKAVTEIDEFSTNVPDSVFEIPGGYKKVTMEELAAMMGG